VTPMAPTVETAAMTRADLLADLEQQVSVMIRRIRRVIGERSRAVHPELQSSSYLMLSWLNQHGPQRASAMAEAFGIDKGAISRQVQHLLDLGLIDRTPDPADGRATLISISADASRRMAEVAVDRRRWLDDRLVDWDDDDLAEFVRMLGGYNAALDA
jgi:DNA-binding MarR family transcriptional regulator